ncbi:hypothetical protein [Paraburkholderia sp. J8-2]|uniref:hypothetical protein n=1 Tax=Paraburkholderia sp. J8-2 TaxID=2805440 RepID=UPI002AB79304|nr:hypothetical protein [Paraburkholderia sp. J8-2]
MRNLPVMPKITAAAVGDPATFCFRYRSGRRHHRLYDVLMTLNDPGGICHIEVCHALPAGADLPPLAAGRLNAARLTRAVDLLGLLKQVTAHDHTRLQPGRLVFDAHMQLPWRPTGAPASAGAQRAADSTAARHTPSAFGTVDVNAQRSTDATLAHRRVRYPLHGLGRGAQLHRRAKAG